MKKSPPPIYIGTDSGATTSKTGGVYADGSIITERLRQSSTNARAGTGAVVRGWVDGIEGFLADNGLAWEQVHGVGLAIPGPYQAYGILDRAANLPDSFEGWNFHADFSAALAARAGRPLPLVAGNDGNYGGVAEARRVRGDSRATVLLLAPGSGLGCAYVGADGLALEGDTLAGMEGGHMPAAVHLLEAPVYQCGCGRDWGCIEPYTTISGLPQLLRDTLKRHPGHELATSTDDIQTRVLSLRTRAQHGDPLALDIFDFQAKALGIHLATLAMAPLTRMPPLPNSASATSTASGRPPFRIFGQPSAHASKSSPRPSVTSRRPSVPPLSPSTHSSMRSELPPLPDTQADRFLKRHRRAGRRFPRRRLAHGRPTCPPQAHWHRRGSSPPLSPV